MEIKHLAHTDFDAFALRQCFDAASMRMHAAVSRRRIGALLGGDRGQAMVDEANAWLEGQTIQCPTRWAQMIAPVASS